MSSVNSTATKRGSYFQEVSSVSTMSSTSFGSEDYQQHLLPSSGEAAHEAATPSNFGAGGGSSINDPVLRRYSREYSRSFQPLQPAPPPSFQQSAGRYYQQQQPQQPQGRISSVFSTSKTNATEFSGLPKQSPAPSSIQSVDRRSDPAEVTKMQVASCKLQMRLQAEESARKRQKIESEQQINRLKEENIRLHSREGAIEERGRLASVSSELQSLRDEYRDYRNQMQRSLEDCQRTAARLAREKLELEERSTADKEQLAMELKEARNRVFELTSRELRVTEDARLQAELRTRELAEWKKYLSEREAELAECSQLRARVNELEMQATLYEAERARLKSANEAIDRFEQVRQLNSRLKEQLTAAQQIRDDRLVLEEEVRSLRHRLEAAESRASRLASDLAEATANKPDAASSSSSTKHSALEAESRLAAVQRELALVTSGRAELLAATSAADKSITESAAARMEAECRAGKAEAATKRLEAELAAVKRKIQLLAKERDMLKDFVASYRLDCTLGGSGSELAYLKRIDQMESLLDDYKRQLDEELAKTSTTIATTASANPQSRLSLPAQSQQQQQQQQQQQPTPRLSLCDMASRQEASLVAELRQQITQLHERLAAAEEDKEILAAREARLSDLGDADPRFIRVVHLAQNPAQEAEEARERELTDLRKKLEKAVTRCEKLEEKLKNRAQFESVSAGATSTVGDMTRDVSMIVGRSDLLAQIERLQNELEKKELQKQRQLEVFTVNTGKMREAVHRLLGYGVELVSNNPSERLFRITSTFVDHDQQNPERTSFLFRLDNSQVDLLTTDYVAEWQSDVRHYVQENNSVPAFLAAVTLNYFSSSTTMAASSSTTVGVGATNPTSTMPVD